MNQIHFNQFVDSFIRTDEDTKNPCAQYLVTNETNSAMFGDLRHILNLEAETICVVFESPIGNIICLSFYFSVYNLIG